MHISLIDIVISIALKSVKFHWFWFREYGGLLYAIFT